MKGVTQMRITETFICLSIILNFQENVYNIILISLTKINFCPICSLNNPWAWNFGKECIREVSIVIHCGPSYDVQYELQHVHFFCS